MKTAVLDSHALLTFLFKDPGCETVLALFEKAATKDFTLIVDAINWALVASTVENKVGPDQWRLAREKLLGLPLQVVPADQELAELGSEVSVRWNIPLPQSIAAALAKKKKVELYTSDQQFRVLTESIKIRWL